MEDLAGHHHGHLGSLVLLDPIGRPSQVLAREVARSLDVWLGGLP